MERWEGKVAIVTGASSGIGAAIAKALVEKGLDVVGLARRIDKIEELASSLSEAPGKLHAVRCDLSKEDDILKTFQWIKRKVGIVHILINNAGVSLPTNLTDGSTDEWRRTMDINVLALCICTREAIKIMKKHNIAGHIVHLNSIVGQYVVSFPHPVLNVYPASKFAVTALTETLRLELNHQKSRIKVSSISPGMVHTDFFQNCFPEEISANLFNVYPSLKAEDVAESVVYVLSTGPNVQVHELVIRPLGEPF